MTTAPTIECQFCQSLIASKDATKICKNCSTVIHRDCWEAFEQACPTSHCGAREGWTDGYGIKEGIAPELQEQPKDKCRVCKAQIRPVDNTMICNACDTATHFQCWQMRQKVCPKPKCGGKAGFTEGKGVDKQGAAEEPGVLGKFFQKFFGGNDKGSKVTPIKGPKK